jgi:hypothetical protein
LYRLLDLLLRMTTMASFVPMMGASKPTLLVFLAAKMSISGRSAQFQQQLQTKRRLKAARPRSHCCQHLQTVIAKSLL